MEEAQNSKVKPGILPEAVFEFLWYAPDVPEKELSDLPLVRYFDDLGLLTVRSSWKRDAKVLTIKCSPPGGIKQWREGWKIRNEEGIELFSLSIIIRITSPTSLPAGAIISPVRMDITAT